MAQRNDVTLRALQQFCRVTSLLTAAAKLPEAALSELEVTAPNSANARGFNKTLHGLVLLLLLLLLAIVNLYCRSSAAATASRERANCRSIVLRACFL
jgi:ferric-dicitrate binding protein FerR (iron transport regulator)